MTSAVKKNFGRAVAEAHRGEVVGPILRSLLFDPTFPEIRVRIPSVKQSEDYRPDGWFHPSTHPLWTPRQLYYYVLFSERMVREPFDPIGTLAVNNGKFWHAFFQQILLHHNVLRPNDGTHCRGCKENRAEHFTSDDEVMSSGHCDGDLGEDLWEFKTAHPQKVRLFNSLGEDPTDITTFVEKHPDYYAQALEYLRMMGRDRMILTMMSPVYPFQFKEFHIRFAKGVARQVRDKYAMVRGCAADGTPPPPCCLPQSSDARECWARLVCPVGSA
jgi:hypothetical protein